MEVIEKEIQKEVKDLVGAPYGPQMVVSANNLYVALTDNTTGDGDIYFNRAY